MLILVLSLCLFHLNTCSLNKNFDNLEYLLLLKTTNQTFDIIAISDLRILKNLKITKSINLTNYVIE